MIEVFGHLGHRIDLNIRSCPLTAAEAVGITRVRFALGASFLLARGGTQRVPANPPPAAGFDNPTGAIFAPKLKSTRRQNRIPGKLS